MQKTNPETTKPGAENCTFSSTVPGHYMPPSKASKTTMSWPLACGHLAWQLRWPLTYAALLFVLVFVSVPHGVFHGR